MNAAGHKTRTHATHSAALWVLTALTGGCAGGAGVEFAAADSVEILVVEVATK